MSVRVLSLRLFVQPCAQAMLAALSVLATTRLLYAPTAVVVVGLNLLWWSNTRLNRHTDHVPAAGVIYAVGYTCGHLLGMAAFDYWGVR